MTGCPGYLDLSSFISLLTSLAFSCVMEGAGQLSGTGLGFQSLSPGLIPAFSTGVAQPLAFGASSWYS